MSRGFIYVVKTVQSDYEQRDFTCVPTVWRRRIYFASCKIPMRPRMNRGDWIFGVSPSPKMPRRIVFTGQIEEVTTFADAYVRFEGLRGPTGPISVRPVARPGRGYARSHYEPIPDSTHEDSWENDIATPELDRFFVCHEVDGFRNRWLGAGGPTIDEDILAFFNQCAVHGQSASGSQLNQGRPTAPITLGGTMYKGLHLETDEPNSLLDLCEARVGGLFPERKARRSASGKKRGGC